MSFLTNQMTAIQNGFAAYRLALTGGPNSHQWGAGSRMGQYALCWDAYRGGLYDIRRGYASYLADHRLYSKTRFIYGDVAGQVDFYAFSVYPGVIDDQGAPNPDRLAQGIPLLADEYQRAAIIQAWQWANWARASTEWITYGAAVGDTFLVAVDDVEGGKVYPETRAPWQIKELHRDKRGHVLSSVEEYQVWDSQNRKWYQYRREMDLEHIKTYRDGALFDYGGGADNENFYGWVPMVCTQHSFNPDLPGVPAFRNWNALNEVNSLASRLSDYIKTQADSPMILAGAGNISTVKIDGRVDAVEDRQVRLLQMAENVTPHQITGNLDLADTEVRIESLLKQLRESNLESTTYQRLREMGDISGVAARRLLGDVQGRLSGPAGNYDSGQILALRQCVAIGGMRARERQGGWRDLSEQQRAFLPFDLTSYPKGDLDFGIASRPLIADTELDKAAARQMLFASYQAGIGAGIPLDFQLTHAASLESGGLSEPEIIDLHAAQVAAVKQSKTVAIPTVEKAAA